MQESKKSMPAWWPERDERSYGFPVKDCPVCNAFYDEFYKGDLSYLQTQTCEAVMKHVTENHNCRPPAIINCNYRVQVLLVNVSFCEIDENDKYKKFSVRGLAFWEEDLNCFKVYFHKNFYNEPVFVEPNDIEHISICFDISAPPTQPSP